MSFLKQPVIMFHGKRVVLSQDNMDIDGTVLLKIDGVLQEFQVQIGTDGSQYVHLGGEALDLDEFCKGELE